MQQRGTGWPYRIAMARYTVRQRFALALAAPVVLVEGREPDQLGGWSRDGVTRARGEDDLYEHACTYVSTERIIDRASFDAWCAAHAGSDAVELARFVNIVGLAVWGELVEDLPAWRLLLEAADRAVAAYSSWVAFEVAYVAGGGPGDVAAARRVWAELPWPT